MISDYERGIQTRVLGLDGRLRRSTWGEPRVREAHPKIFQQVIAEFDIPRQPSSYGDRADRDEEGALGAGCHVLSWVEIFELWFSPGAPLLSNLTPVRSSQVLR